MKNTLTDLNNILFEQLQRLQEAEKPEDLQTELDRSAAVAKVSDAVIRNGELAFKVMQHTNEMGYSNRRDNEYLAPVPEMLEAR